MGLFWIVFGSFEVCLAFLSHLGVLGFSKFPWVSQACGCLPGLYAELAGFLWFFWTCRYFEGLAGIIGMFGFTSRFAWFDFERTWAYPLGCWCLLCLLSFGMQGVYADLRCQQ